MLSRVINSVCARKPWQTITRLSIVIGRAISSAHTTRWNDVQSLLIIYSNYHLWMLTHVLSFCIISFVVHCEGIVTSRFATFSWYVILANLLQCMCSHWSVFLSFFIIFWVFFGISPYVFHAKLVMSTDVNDGLVIALCSNYFRTRKNFINTILK